MLSIDEILRMPDFEKFSKGELLEIVYAMQQELKYYKYHKDRVIDELNSHLNIAREKNIEYKNKLDIALKTNKKFSQHLFKKLTIKERLRGFIDVNNTEESK